MYKANGGGGGVETLFDEYNKSDWIKFNVYLYPMSTFFNLSFFPDVSLFWTLRILLMELALFDDIGDFRFRIAESWNHSLTRPDHKPKATKSVMYSGLASHSPYQPCGKDHTSSLSVCKL